MGACKYLPIRGKYGDGFNSEASFAVVNGSDAETDFATVGGLKTEADFAIADFIGRIRR